LGAERRGAVAAFRPGATPRQNRPGEGIDKGTSLCYRVRTEADGGPRKRATRSRGNPVKRPADRTETARLRSVPLRVGPNPTETLGFRGSGCRRGTTAATPTHPAAGWWPGCSLRRQRLGR
jgi:hypothetical protein